MRFIGVLGIQYKQAVGLQLEVQCPVLEHLMFHRPIKPSFSAILCIGQLHVPEQQQFFGKVYHGILFKIIVGVQVAHLKPGVL